MSDKTHGSPNDHLANERTFLAWIRTSLGMMAFGFAVAKFNLFVTELATHAERQGVPSRGVSSSFGIVLVAIGALIGVLSYLRYKSVEQRINTGNFRSSGLLLVFVAVFICLIGIMLILYLLNLL